MSKLKFETISDEEFTSCTPYEEIFFSHDLVDTASSQLLKFKQTVQHMLSNSSSGDISFAENLAFRYLGSIDWNKKNFDEFKTLFSPIVYKKHFSLDSLLSKKHGKHFKFKDTEINKSIHDWCYWRKKLNDVLYEKNEQSNTDPSENELHLLKLKNFNQEIDLEINNSTNESNKEACVSYIISKWSQDDSQLNFSTYMHYGIPRAKLRILNEESEVNQTNLGLDLTFNFESLLSETGLEFEDSQFQNSIHQANLSSPHLELSQDKKTYYYRRKYAPAIKETSNSLGSLFSKISSKKKEEILSPKRKEAIKAPGNKENYQVLPKKEIIRSPWKKKANCEKHLNSSNQTKSHDSSHLKGITNVKGGLITTFEYKGIGTNVYFPSSNARH